MPDADSTAQSRCESSATPDAPGSQPCSVRDALLSSLKRESPEMPDAPEDEPEAQAPERKRRRRRGIKDASLRLNDDMMQLVIPYLGQTSVRHLFLMMMVNQDYYAMVTEAHGLWETLFKAWERKLCHSRPHLNRSIGSDLAARCFQAMPKWMVKHNSVKYYTEARPHPSMPTPYMNAVVGNDWRETGVPAEMRPSFERYTRKVLCLWHIGCCGVCGTRQGKQRAVWALNMRVCRGCWLENIVSHRTLLKEYGIDLLKPLHPGAEPLYKVLKDKVFYIRNFMPPSSREKYTQALADYPDNKSTLPLWLLWRPHLETIVDLRARRVEYAAKREAAARLTARVARRFAEVLRNSYLPRQASVQIQRIWKLRHNEIRRQQLPPVCLDSIEDYRFARQRQELINYADLGVNKDVGFPVRYVQA